jgi:hypothetical protein
MSPTNRRRSDRLARTIIAVVLPLGAASAAEEGDDGGGRLELVCTEQPMRAVSFGEPGEVDYGQQPPKEAEPVGLTVTKTAPGEDFKFDYATIEATVPDLAVDEAIWISGKQVEAQEGRFKINLDNLVMTLTETDPDGSARFRRFECEAQGPSQ